MAGLDVSTVVGVIGAGTMGAGIAQVAAAAGHRVKLFDVQKGAAVRGKANIAKGLSRLVARGKKTSAECDALVDRIEIVDELDDFADAGLVVEAIVENLAIKQELFGNLERIMVPGVILASNTSSLSITAIGANLKDPSRLVGMHFFNPAPVMKLVEVISGLETDPSVADCIIATSGSWGKVPVKAKSTPGFIVNRVARPYYAEALRLLEEGAADAATIDAAMTECGGFRMGPFALMDLIGIDVNYTVTCSVFDAYYNDPRFRPSLVQKEMVDAGWFGRKSGRGFFDYSDNTAPVRPTQEEPSSTSTADIALGSTSEIDGVLVTATDGRSAAQRAQADGRPVILFDLALDYQNAKRIVLSKSEDVPAKTLSAVIASLQAMGKSVSVVKDSPGLIVMRTVAMLANEAFEAVLHGVADEAGIDAAMMNGVNYPAGPLSWARAIGVANVLEVLENIECTYRDPRYRPSLGLRRAVWCEF